MKTLANAIILLAAATAGGFAQQWEFGVAGGYGLAASVPVTATQPAGTATAGFAPGAALSVYFGQNVGRFVGGEIRYAYLMDDARIESGGNSVTFTAISHALHYDLILHTPSKSPVQFFVALGGGFRIFEGTGAESAYQPLMQYAYLTKTHTLKPMGSAGAGVKFAVSKKILLRIEARDYITPFPTEVVTPAVGATFGRNILHDIVPMFGLSYAF
jgi:hypothetical protein